MYVTCAVITAVILYLRFNHALVVGGQIPLYTIKKVKSSSQTTFPPNISIIYFTSSSSCRANSFISMKVPHTERWREVCPPTDSNFAKQKEAKLQFAKRC